jgi:uncharacterized membrane protein YccC
MVQSLVGRLVELHLSRFRRGGRPAVAWALRLTAAAVAGYLVASWIFPETHPLLAPLTALLVVQLTPVSLLASGLDRVLSVVAGVSVAVLFSAVVPLAWWSLGLLIAVSLLIGQALRLGPNLVEVPISAMLVISVGSLGAESAGWKRITETLVGAGVGVLSNLLFPPKVATDEAGIAIQGLADDLTRLLDRAGSEMTRLDMSGTDVAAHATGWLDDARLLTHNIPNVGSALLRAEQGRRLNLRALGTPDTGPGLRQGLEALEHSAVVVRSMFRSILDATSDPSWPAGDIGRTLVGAVAQLLHDLAAGLGAFGQMVHAQAQPQLDGKPPEIAKLQQALDGLHEARDRVSDLLLVGGPPVVTELNFALLSTVKRLLIELDLDERIRRQLRLRPPTTPRVIRPTRRLDGPR